jgi:hypothetical protein
MKLRVGLGLCLVSIGAFTAIQSTDAAIARVGCTAPKRIGSDNPNIGEVEAHGMACRSARAAIINGHLSRGGNLVTPGFACHVVHRYEAGGTVLGAKIRCRSGNRRFAFSWAT